MTQLKLLFEVASTSHEAVLHTGDDVGAGVVGDIVGCASVGDAVGPIVGAHVSASSLQNRM